MFVRLAAGLLVALSAFFAPEMQRVFREASGGAENLITKDDLRPAGFYEFLPRLGQTSDSMGLTLRKVGGDTRFLYVTGSSKNLPIVDEVTIKGLNFGDSVMPTQIVRTWPTPFAGSRVEPGYSGNFHKLHWDEAGKRLWTTWGVSYTSVVVPTQIAVRTLNDDLSIGDFKQISLAGISAKRVWGGCVAVPASFQSTYGTGPWACGFGGQTSIARGGGIASFGPTMYLFGDPAGYANGQQIPSGSFKTAMDYSRGTLMDDDWYRRGEVTNGDRAPRLTHPRNFVDYASNSQPLTLSGTVNTSGSTVTLVKEALGRDFSTCPIAAWPKSGTCWWVGLTGKFTINDVAYTVTAYRSPTQVTVTPSPGTQTAVAFTSPSPFDATPLFEPSALPGAQWLSPAPDGKGRWTMVDAAAGGCWFSRGVKTGFLLYATLGAGDVAYANGFIASTKAAHELHVYSQARLGEGVSGATPPWKVHPDAMYDLTDRLPLGPHGALQSGAYGASPGAITCDDETGDVWIRASKAGESRPGPTNYDRLYLFKCPACAPQPKFPLPLASVLAVFAASRLMRRCAP